MRLDLGTEVRCSDGDLGELADIVIDPTTRRVTHLVVEPKHEYFTPRLVPVDLVGSADATPIVLTCSIEEAGKLEHAEEIAYLRLGEFPVDDPRYDVQVTEMLALPYYEGLDMPTAGVTRYGQGVDVRYQRVPKGEIEIRVPFQSNLTQQHGFLHAGVVASALDSACGGTETLTATMLATIMTLRDRPNVVG